MFEEEAEEWVKENYELSIINHNLVEIGRLLEDE